MPRTTASWCRWRSRRRRTSAGGPPRCWRTPGTNRRRTSRPWSNAGSTPTCRSGREKRYGRPPRSAADHARSGWAGSCRRMQGVSASSGARRSWSPSTAGSNTCSASVPSRCAGSRRRRVSGVSSASSSTCGGWRLWRLLHEPSACRLGALDCGRDRHPGARDFTVAFDGGEITSDAGLLLVREFDERLGLTAALREAVSETRDRRYVTHDLLALLRQRVYQIAAGYEDANDAGFLRADPTLQTVAQ